MSRRPQYAFLLLTFALFLSSPALGVDLATEIWVAPSHNTATDIGDWAVTSTGDTHFSFAVPADFGSLTGVKVLLIGPKNTKLRYDLYLSISSNMLAHDVFRNVSLANGPVTVTKNGLLEVDVTDVFDFSVTIGPDTLDFPQDLLRGEDYLSLHVVAKPKGQGRIVGLRFQYDAVPQLGGEVCPDGLVAGFAPDGSLICKPDNQACQPDALMVGFDLDGTPICKPDNQVCPPGTVMVGFDLSGAPLCKPDRANCAPEEVMVGFPELNGTPTCRSDTVACGRECFGGADNGEPCQTDDDCAGTGACYATVLVGFDLRGNLDCRSIAELQQAPPGSAIAIQALVEADEGTDGTTPFTFPVTRSPALGLGETETVNFTVQGLDATGGATCATGVDFIAQSGPLTFTDADCGSGECNKNIVVQVCADSDAEDDESFEVVLTPALGSPSDITQDTGTGVILDDDGGAPTTVTLTVVISGLGGVNGPGISCPSDCMETYSLGETVSLLARPLHGFSFTGWSGDCSGNEQLFTLTMDADKTCTATFN